MQYFPISPKELDMVLEPYIPINSLSKIIGEYALSWIDTEFLDCIFNIPITYFNIGSQSFLEHINIQVYFDSDDYKDKLGQFDEQRFIDDVMNKEIISLDIDTIVTEYSKEYNGGLVLTNTRVLKRRGDKFNGANILCKCKEIYESLVNFVYVHSDNEEEYRIESKIGEYLSFVLSFNNNELIMEIKMI